MKKLLCLLLCLSVLFSATAVFAAAEDFQLMCVHDPDFDIAGWYSFLEPVYRWKTARARVLNPDGWKETKSQLTYVENGQIENTIENQDLLLKLWADTAEKDDPSFVLGDFNKNGCLDVNDARTVMRLSVGLEEFSEELTPDMADVSLDDKVDVNDARLILMAAVGYGDGFVFDLTFKDDTWFNEENK